MKSHCIYWLAIIKTSTQIWGFLFKSYLVNTLNIPEICILECDEHKFYNPKTGDTAVEWYGIFIIDYSKLSHDNGTFFIPPSTWPSHDTVYLLGVKQVLNTTEVLSKIPEWISKADLNCRIEKALSLCKGEAAESAISEGSEVRRAVGGRNVRGSIEKEVLQSGYLAIRPTAGDDFKVIESRRHHLKVFNATTACWLGIG